MEDNLINSTVESLDALPETLRPLYEERDGKYLLKYKIADTKTEADFIKVQRALQAEREEKKNLKAMQDRYKALGELEDLQAKLDRIEELERLANKGGKPDNTNSNTDDFEIRLNSKLKPLERQRDDLQRQLQETLGKVQEYEQERKAAKIERAITAAAAKMKVLPSALEDAILHGTRALDIHEDKVITVDGDSVDMWLKDMVARKPHWLEPTAGGGARGSSGVSVTKNPYDRKAGTWNLTEQAKIESENPGLAKELQKRAGLA